MSSQPQHILIIDDDPSVLTVFGQYFESKGFSVDQAADGMEAMHCLHRRRADLIITDILMPDKDGLELIREVRSEFPDLPIIAISGGMRNASMSFLPLAKKFGAVHVFEKPVALSDLYDAVQNLLSRPSADNR